MKRKINFEVLIQLIILIGLTVLLLFALITGKAENYVHPRLNIYLWFSAAALLSIAFFILPGLFQPQHRPHIITYFIIFLPLITAVLIPVGTMNSKSISLGNTGVSSNKGAVIPNTTQPVTSADTTSSVALPTADKNGMIQVSDEQFSKWYTDINQNMKQAEGKVYRFKGQVFRIDDFTSQEFVPARKAMVCCVADLQPCGILCRSSQAKTLATDTWVWITAKIKIESYKGENMPIGYVTKIEKAEKPKEEYIYPVS